MTPSFTNMINEEYRNINKYTPVSILHAKRCDNLTGDMSILSWIQTLSVKLLIWISFITYYNIVFK